MEEERQAIVQVVGVVEVKMRVTEVKEGENFKIEETIKFKKYIVKSQGY